MENILGSIMGSAIGSIITLIGSIAIFVKTKNNDNIKSANKIFKEKHEQLKEVYKKYKKSYSYISITDYEEICLDTSKSSFDRVNECRKIHNEYIERLTNVIDVLNEDYYFIQKIIDYNGLKDLFILIIKTSTDITYNVFMYEFYHTIEKNEIMKYEIKFNELIDKMDNSLENLEYKLQEKLYKNLK